MAKRFTCRLTAESIDKVVEKLNSYKATLERKAEKFVEMLAEEGVRVAAVAVSGSDYDKFIEFSIENDEFEGHHVATVIAYSQPQIEMWQSYGEVVAVEIMPILFEEFGSGNFSENPLHMPGVGRGTFPGQTHAFENSWMWEDLEGNWHESSGYKPSMPMYQASLRLHLLVQRIAQEVFG